MIVREFKKINDNGVEVLQIEFSEHKKVIFTRQIPLKYEKCPALRTAKAKEAVIDEFLTTFEGQKFTKKEVLKAYSKTDSYFKDLYKQMFPHGGYRGGGKKKGEKFSDKTERLTTRISPEEKQLLSETLENYRKNEKRSHEEIKSALAPIFRRIDESFGDNETARQKWRKKVGNINPALFPQLLEYILLFGIDKLVPEEKINRI